MFKLPGVEQVVLNAALNLYRMKFSKANLPYFSKKSGPTGCYGLVHLHCDTPVKPQASEAIDAIA